jgi:ribonucleotide reductase alpha subunit
VALGYWFPLIKSMDRYTACMAFIALASSMSAATPRGMYYYSCTYIGLRILYNMLHDDPQLSVYTRPKPYVLT